MIKIKTRGELQFHTNYEDMYCNIQDGLKQYLKDSGLKSLILGVSGGVDSALCAALTAPVCSELGINLVGASLSIVTNKKEEKKRASNVGEAFCTKFFNKKLDKPYKALVKAYKGTVESFTELEHAKKIRLGNIKARMRMIYLYNLAQYYRGMVLSTDNYTEYLLGFWTLHGDVGDYGPFQNLWKTEVYGLAQWIVDNKLTSKSQKKALQSCIDAVPTDGLGITDSDLDQLGCKTYLEVDKHLLSIFFPPVEIEGWPTTEYLTILKRHEASEFKRSNPFNHRREQILRSTDLPF